MKKFLIDLIASEVMALIAIPSVIIGMYVAGKVYGDKVEPWLEKRLKNKKSTLD